MSDKPDEPRTPSFIHISQSHPVRGIHISGSIKGFGRLIDSPNAEVHDLTIDGGTYEVGDDFIRVAGGSNFQIHPDHVTNWKQRRAELAELMQTARRDKTPSAVERVKAFLLQFARPSEIDAVVSLVERALR